MMSSGTICSFSKPSAQMPMMKPNRLKVTEVSTMNSSMRGQLSTRRQLAPHAAVHGADLGHLQPVRLHHRHLGRRLRKAADRAAAHHHAADLPRRQLLFHTRPAAVLAGG